ncbi:lytic transglycosylase [Lysobacteraceae bacterium NML08-0793]|nr:lytic transglycosylase [Xanthomonadaceae bacterium NML08-0793]
MASLLVCAPAQTQAQRVPRAVQQILDQAQAIEARFAAAEEAEQQDAALTEMEKLIAQCSNVRGCQVQSLTPVYRRMLQPKAADAPQLAGRDELDEGDEDEDPINFTGQSVPTAATADALLDERNKRFVQMVQFNPAVQEGIRRWLTDMRPALMESYVNYQYLRPHMAPAFQRAGLPEALLFGIMAKESNGKVHVSSRAGASGPLQFMPATGRRFGLGPDGTGFDTRFDARMSAEAAAAYLQERYAQLDSNIEMSLAAYNGGEGRALRIYNQNGGRSFWDISVYNQFPQETRDYVPMVIAAAWLYLHPAEYGLRFPRTWGAGRVSQIQLKRASSINELTICLGNARGSNGYQRALRNLNPRYRINDPLPEGTMLTVTNTIASLYNRYCVSGKRAETARQLMASSVSSALVRGSTAPVGEVRVGELTTDVAAPQASAPAPATARATTPSRPAAPARAQAQRPRSHRVARGETLNAIARRYDCSVQQLASANHIRGPRYAISPGQTLRLVSCKK